MKKLIALMVVGGTVLGLVVLAGALGFLTYEVTQNSCSPGQVSIVPVSEQSSTGLTVKGADMTPVQLGNAQKVVEVVAENGLPARAAEIAIMAAIVESRLINVPYGDRDSIGLFQQRNAWGPRRVRMNPRKATQMFLYGGMGGQPGLTDIENWELLDRGVAAQTVQVSAYPERYAEYETEAINIVAALMDGAVTTASAECEDEQDPVEQMVEAAEAMVGDDYSWQDRDGSGLLAEAAEQAGFELPEGAEELASYKGDEEAGVSTEWIPADRLPDKAERGYIYAWSSDPDATSPSDADTVGVATGWSEGVRIATFNVLGSNHPSAIPALERIETQVSLIRRLNLGVVGLQELRPDQRTKMLKLFQMGGSDYAIYPRQPMYGRQQESVNSIIWNTTQFEFVSGTTVPMPWYFNMNRQDIPQVTLRHIDSGQEIVVINTHDPAKLPYAKARWLDAKVRARQVDQLARDEETHVFVTGDFNSGYAVRLTNNPNLNPTYQNKYLNLTWCVMTKSGEVLNGYDAVRDRTGQCPRQTSREMGTGEIDHVYTDKDVEVSDYQYVRNGTASDHPVVYAEVMMGAGPAMDHVSTGAYVGVSKNASAVALRKIRPAGLLGALKLTVSTPQLSASGEWTFPLKKGTYRLSSQYGPRNLGSDDFHNGTDFGTNGNTPPLFAMHDGRIIGVGYEGAWGNHLLVETGVPVPDRPGETYKYLYAHLSAYAPGLQSDDTLKVGELVGYVGNTGNSFGAHLHLTICETTECMSGNEVGSTDPMPFLASVGVTP